MQAYANNSGKSNIVAYQIGNDYIVVQFANSAAPFYKYTYASAGQTAISIMIRLAQNGRGLNTYISSTATRPSHESKGATLESVL